MKDFRPETLAIILLCLLTMAPPSSKYPCGVCSVRVKWSDRAVCCDRWDKWFHAKCVNMRDTIYMIEVNQPNVSWYCWTCGLPNFFSELFATVSASTTRSSLGDISRASSLSSHSTLPKTLQTADTASSIHSDEMFHFHGTPPPFSTPAGSISRPSFDSKPPTSDLSHTHSQSQNPTPVKPNKSLRTLIAP